MFLSCELHEPVGYKGTYFLCGVTLHSHRARVNQWKFSSNQRCVQVAIHLLIFECYFSTLDHHPLSSRLLFPTASSYKLILLYLSQDDSTTEVPCFSDHKTRRDFFVRHFWKKNNDECILILVIYWKKTGLLHTKISNHNIIYSS